jgi:aspartyl-tRNA(Asn)/glutamyl-tRNA(Gln) amidotransferase subunit C
MKQQDVKHLAALSRLELSEAEVEAYTKEMSAILEYVSAVQGMAGEGALEPKVGARFNVFRPDEVTNEPGAYTKDLLREMPQTDGRFMVVKKILNPDS